MRASNRKAHAILRAREETLEARAKADLREIMSTPIGRRFVWALIEHAGVFGPSFASEALATAYNEGRRSIGLGLLTRCHADAPDLYTTALTEQLAEQAIDSSTRSAANATPDPEDTP